MRDNSHPYVGPRPFERRDRERFFGREREAGELLSRVIAHPIVLLYSQSGAGKTSLVNARLVPLLESEGFRVFPTARVRGQIPHGIAPGKRLNPYVFNALMSWAGEKSEPEQLSDLSIHEFLRRAKPAGGDGAGFMPSAIVFDQFEELFTFYPERWQERHDFFGQIAHALDNDHTLRVVFVMREDYIAELDPYTADLPGNLRTRFRLEQLREEAAHAAVKDPLDGTGLSFAEGVAEQLVTNLQTIQVKTAAGVVLPRVGEFVEPVQLQVVCQTLWARMRESGAQVITHDHIRAFGDVDEALSSFYEKCVEQTVQATGLNEGQLRRWFENTLITPAGTRGTVFRGHDHAGGIPVGAVDALEELHLIRVELRGGARWYELTHDRLIEPIKTSNQKWLLQHSAAEETRCWLEQRAREWVDGGRGSGGLLDEGELQRANQFFERPDAADVGYSDTMIAFVQASRATVEEARHDRDRALEQERQRRAEAERQHVEQQQRALEHARTARRFRWLTVALALACAGALGGAAVAIRMRAVAEARASEAVASQRREMDALLKWKEERQKLDILADVVGGHAAAATTHAADAIKFRADAEIAQKIGTLTRDALSLRQANRPKEALEKYQELRRIYRALPDRAGEAMTLISVGEAYREMNDFPKAEESYKSALNIRRRLPGPINQQTATIHDHLAQLYVGWGKYAEAVEHETRAANIWATTLGPHHKTTIHALDRLDELKSRIASAGSRD